MRAERHEPQRNQRQLPTINSDLTIGSRNLSPFGYGRHEGGSKLSIEPLSPYIAELKRTRPNIESRRQSPNRSFRIHEYLGRVRDHSLQHTVTIADPKSLATIYLPRRKLEEGSTLSYTPTTPANIQQQMAALNRAGKEGTKNQTFRLTKYYQSKQDSSSTPLVNPDNLRKIAYTIGTNKSNTASIETPTPASGKPSVPKKGNFRNMKYTICSDEIKQTTAAASTSAANNDADFDNLMDYVDLDTDLPQYTANKKPSTKLLNEQWPEKIRSVSQIEMQVCRLGNGHISAYPSNYIDEQNDREDYVSELADPPNNRRTKVAAYCADFTFEPTVRQERRLNWSEML